MLRLKKIKPVFKQKTIFYGMKKVWSINFPLADKNKPYTSAEIRSLAKK